MAVYLEKSSLSLDRSAILECTAALVSLESVFHSTNSAISRSTNALTLVCLSKTTFEMKKTSIASNAGICVFISRSQGSIEECRFKGPSTRDIRNIADVNDDHWEDKCLRLCAGSSLTLRKSCISNFRWAVLCSGWDS